MAYTRLAGESEFRFCSDPIPARRYWLTVLGLLALLLVSFYQYRLSVSFDPDVYASLLRNVVNRDDCQIPHVDPFDETIQKYLKPVTPLVCKRLQPELTRLVNGKLLLDLEELRLAGYEPDSLKCQTRCFWRKDGDDISLEYAEWSDLVNASSVECEFVEVGCWKRFPPLRVYANLHNQVLVKPELLTPTPTPTTINKSTDSASASAFRPSVLLFVVDSVSQSNWKRNLPETLAVLEGEYGATVFEGFTKVGDNSFPNAVAFLTGKRVLTVGFENELPGDMSEAFFDDWPLIWKDFKQQDYVTCYAEDYPDFNLFKYLANGFRQPPTDHYFRPFWLQLYGSFLHRRSTHLCFGNQQCHQLQLNYLSQFVSKYAAHNASFFALNWLTELGHDWLNQVALGDRDIATFFRTHREALRDSFVFVFADHGHRFDPIRQSMIGRIEERMPFFSMALPEKLRKSRPEVLHVVRENAQQLTSFWDLYVTLRDILVLARTDSWGDLAQRQQQEAVMRSYSPRGLSLLRPLPPKRNCADAGVPEDFCVCQRENQISPTDARALAAAQAIVDKVNALLQPHHHLCARLSLLRVEHAQTFLPNVKIATDGAGLYVMYRVAVVVGPSDAFLEGTVRHAVQGDPGFTVVGDVNRINKYGNQSACVNTALLRKYCFCTQQLPSPSSTTATAKVEPAVLL